MIALVCPECGSFLIAADRPAGSTVSCQACHGNVGVPADAPKDSDLARVMQKAVQRYGEPKKERRPMRTETPCRFQDDTRPQPRP